MMFKKVREAAAAIKARNRGFSAAKPEARVPADLADVGPQFEGIDEPEPGLRTILFAYYRPHFTDFMAKRLANDYLRKVGL